MEDKVLEILKALSDETRLRILNLLYEKELCVCNVMEILHISQAKASRHLIYLKNAGLVKDRKAAQWAYYSLSNNNHLKFVDTLVYDNLRSMDLYADDLKSLAERLQKGENECEHA
ncbi:MAG: metalloregulator ArsR/SmtB family transcription factor [Acidaminococcaceae bacterium]|nr:metalloregulator ArsR/SmtB family transcription factor [Acidaminococcaceae bacterium]